MRDQGGGRKLAQELGSETLVGWHSREGVESDSDK